MNYLIKGNKETGPEVYLFNLPIDKTCRPTSWCKKHCYGKIGYFLRFRKTVKIGAERRYGLSLSDEFVETITKEIHRRKIKLVRVHTIGDFYSEKYVRKWIEIAKNCPQTYFRANTKRRDFKDIILKLNALPNFNIRESLDPSFQTPTMGLPIGTIDTLNIAKNLFGCISDCKKCGYSCWYQKNLSDCFPIIYGGQFRKNKTPKRN